MKRLYPLLFACTLLPAGAFASCGSAYCVINTQWDMQGLTGAAGRSAVDLRYEYIRQDRLRAGSRDISAAEDNSDTVELGTTNRNLVGTFDYSFDDHWGLGAALPMVDREHSHIVDPGGAATVESWDFSRLGDARVLGRYQFDAAASGDRYGLQFGLKLPTGSHDIANAAGTVAERALQPGTGSTDVLLGGFYSYRPQYRDLGWFAQALFQRAVATRDRFRPGDQLTLTAGLNYPVSDAATLLFQLNGLVKKRDTGANAEPDLSGGRYLYASPGASLALDRDTQVYGFVQLPLIGNVNGIQLVARRSFVAGISRRF